MPTPVVLSGGPTVVFLSVGAAVMVARGLRCPGPFSPR